MLLLLLAAGIILWWTVFRTPMRFIKTVPKSTSTQYDRRPDTRQAQPLPRNDECEHEPQSGFWKRQRAGDLRIEISKNHYSYTVTITKMITEKKLPIRFVGARVLYQWGKAGRNLSAGEYPATAASCLSKPWWTYRCRCCKNKHHR